MFLGTEDKKRGQEAAPVMLQLALTGCLLPVRLVTSFLFHSSAIRVVLAWEVRAR